MRSILTGILSGFAFAALGDVVPGQWNEDFSASKAYAEENGMPLVVVWGNQSCGYCNDLTEAIEEPEVVQWALEHPVVLCHKHDPYQSDESKYSKDYLAARDWMDSLKEDTRAGFPHVGVFWAKNTSGETVSRAFTGRPNKMPAEKPRGTSISVLARQFAGSLDLLIGDYVPQADGAFAMGDTDTDRLEINGLHMQLTVPFVRASVGVPTEERLVVSYPAALGAADAEYALEWAAHQTGAFVEVAANWRSDLVGQRMTLRHFTSDGKLLATSHAYYVDERACTVSYPRFFGESFEYGEWTMDYVSACARARDDGGYVLALFTGTMWCPYCHGLDAVFQDGRFIAWAQANKVSLVTFDQALASSPSTAEGTRQARLLTYTAGQDHYVAGQDPHGAKVLRSGAYYMSGKGVSKIAAETGIALTTAKTAQWLAPESTSARCGNPTILLIKDDAVVGRFAPLRNGYVYDVAETLGRLEDLLALSARDDEYDDYRTTTARWIGTGDGFACSSELQISRSVEWYRLSDEKPGRYTFSVAGKTADEAVVLSVYVADAQRGSAAEELVVDLSSSDISRGVTLKVSAYADKSRTVCTGGNTSVFSATLAVTCKSGGGSGDGPGFDPDGKPCFGWQEYDITLWKGFKSAATFNLVNVEGARSVSLTKGSGALPSGLKLAYDKKSGRAALTGTPKKIGIAESEWSVRAQIGRSSKKVEGVESAFRIAVEDPGDYNPQLGKSQNVTIPLFSADGYFAGTLSVSITKQNKISAKYSGTESKTVSFSGTWNEVEKDTGRVSAVLEKSNAVLDLSMGADGVMRAVFEAPEAYSYFAEEDGVRLTGTAAPSVRGDFSAYEGYYTVTLPVVNTNGDVGVSGTAFLTLKMTKTAAKKGQVTYSGKMPNGTKVSGSAVLSQSAESSDCALLPIFKRSGKDVFAAVLKIRADAKQTWGQSGSEKIWTVSSDSVPYQLHRQSGFDFLAAMAVYGGYYEPKSTLPDLVEMHGLSDLMQLQMAGVEPIELTATKKGFSIGDKPSGFSLAFNKTTGLFSGSVRVRTSQGKQTSARFEGALLPGWVACGSCGEEEVERPFGSGTLYYSDKVNRKTVTVSVPVDIIATEKP